MRKTAAGPLGLQPLFVVELVSGEPIWPFMLNAKRHVRNGQPHLQKHLLVERLHFSNILLEGIYVPKSVATLGT